MTRQLTFAAIFLLSSAITSVTSGSIIFDFTAAGANGTANNGGFVFNSQDPTGTGVSFTITASEVNPGGGANGATGNIARINGGLGSTVENTGTFLNVQFQGGNPSDANPGVSETLRFTISNVTGLGPGESIELTALLSQNSNSTTANQSGGFGGTFGQQGVDSVTLTSDNASSVVINQSDAGDLGSSLLLADNANAGNTGNTFAHSGGNLTFTSSFDLALTDLTADNAVVIQGFEFAVISPVPEPSSVALLSIASLGLLVRRRK